MPSTLSYTLTSQVASSRQVLSTKTCDSFLECVLYAFVRLIFLIKKKT
jgi:hypothetical protein